MSNLREILSVDNKIFLLRQLPISSGKIMLKCGEESATPRYRKSFHGKGGKTGGPLSPNMECREITIGALVPRDIRRRTIDTEEVEEEQPS